MTWQIRSNIEFGKFVQTTKEVLKNSENVIVSIPEEIYVNTRYVNGNSTCFSTMPASVLMSESKKVEKVIEPQKYYHDYSPWCFDGNDFTNYDKKNDFLRLQTVSLKPQTKYWDLSTIVEEFKKTGRTIN